MSDDLHSDQCLRHFKSRAQRPCQHANVPSTPLVLVVVSDSSGMRETVDSGARFIRVGTSPVLSPSDQIQARRRAQSWMADN